MEKFERFRNRAKKIIAKNEKNIEKLTKEITEIEESREKKIIMQQKNKEKLKSIKETLEKMEKELDEKNSLIKEKIDEHEKIRNELITLESEKKEIEKKISKEKDSISKYEAKIDKNKNDIDKNDTSIKSKIKMLGEFFKIEKEKEKEEVSSNDGNDDEEVAEEEINKRKKAERISEIKKYENLVSELEKEFKKNEESKYKEVNMSEIDHYRLIMEDYKKKYDEYDQKKKQTEKIRNEYEDLKRKRLNKFMDGFTKISLKLKEIYQTITQGGDAELELVDQLDPFTEGIVFTVRPHKKSWKNIQNLSGGEKTISSLALVFALHHYRPTPIYVMDEIDAALDYRNVGIVGKYIKEKTENAQFIIISLRNNLFDLSDTLIGIYKTNDTTKTVTISPRLVENKI